MNTLYILFFLALAIVFLFMSRSLEGFTSDDCVRNENIETINATVPLRVPLTPRDLSFIGQIDCTNDLDCDYPLKCCSGKCKPPVVRQDTNPDCRFIPMRIKICPQTE